MVWLPDGEKNVLLILTEFTNVTDRRTDIPVYFRPSEDI